MKIIYLSKKASKHEIEGMLETLGAYIKVAVDVRKGILAGGGVMHADCEAVLIEHGSKQKDIWGANWIKKTGDVQYEALINIRPRDNNRKMIIEDPKVRAQVNMVIEEILGDSK